MFETTFMRLCMYIVAAASTSTPYLINPTLQ
jgi:hypothetical protein